MLTETITVAPTDKSDLDDNKVDFVGETDKVFKATRVEGVDINIKVDAIDAFLKTVEDAVKAGEVTSSEGVPYNWSDMLLRLNKLEGMFNGRDNDPEVKDPFLVIPRANHLRAAFVALLEDITTASTLLHEIVEYPKKNEQDANNEVVPEKVRENLGDKAVKASGINNPSVLITGIPDFGAKKVTEVLPEVEVKPQFESLPPSVQNEITDYRMALRVKRESEKAGDYSQAARDAEKVFTVRRRMSEQARDFLGIGL